MVDGPLYITPYSIICQTNPTRAIQLLVKNLPTVREVAFEIIETVFVPKIIARQLAIAIILETGVVSVLCVIYGYQLLTFSNKIEY